jgi:hypothetical protein
MLDHVKPVKWCMIHRNQVLPKINIKSSQLRMEQVLIKYLNGDHMWCLGESHGDYFADIFAVSLFTRLLINAS